MNERTNAVDRYAYSFAIWTDRADFILDKNADLDEEKLLELRSFDEKGEYHAFRSNPGENFSCREITDDEGYADGYLDEAQYLDIDSAKTSKRGDGFVYATGGGVYHLPADRDGDLLLVRTYYRFDSEGMARTCDWRLVGFTAKETVGREK